MMRPTNTINTFNGNNTINNGDILDFRENLSDFIAVFMKSALSLFAKNLKNTYSTFTTSRPASLTIHPSMLRVCVEKLRFTLDSRRLSCSQGMKCPLKSICLMSSSPGCSTSPPSRRCRPWFFTTMSIPNLFIRTCDSTRTPNRENTT